MPRQGRIDIVGCVYHIISRGINRNPIFKDDDDRKEFARRLSESIKKTGNICYGWALMSNHFHLLVKRGRNSVSDLMRKLLTGYAVYYNKRHKRRGYLFQNRYKSILCQEENYLLELIRYIHLNPVRAGVVKDIKSLSNYPWTGYAILTGSVNGDFQEIDEILGRFGKSRKLAAENLSKFMEEGLSQGKREDLTGGGLRRSAGGWSELTAMKRSKEYWRGDDRILGEGQFVENILKEAEQELDKKEKNRQRGYTLAFLIKHVCEKYKIEKRDLRKKGRKNNISKAKLLFAYMAKRDLGVSNREISEVLGCTDAAVSLLMKAGEREIEKDAVNLIS